MSNSATLENWAKQRMAKGSLSFSLATRFFSSSAKADVRLLYSWCRHCDDEIDLAPTKTEQLLALERLERLTRLAFSQTPVSREEKEFFALQVLARRHCIPAQYALDLLRGMRADVENRQYLNFHDLEDYCYCVAGTVGLMMCHIMGVSNPVALRHAVDLGIALQLTNIARDIKEDFKLNRIYIPSDWLKETALDEENFSNRANASSRALMARRLVETAEKYYQSGLFGLRYLNWTAALAVRSGAMIYREIGRRVSLDPEKAWNQRVVVPTTKKISLAIFALIVSIREIRPRLLNPWKRAEHLEVWRAP